MRIDRFRLTGAYGYLNLDVRFNSRMTFLTGINGSGKTTVVRGLVAALSPSFSTLSNTQFEMMSVELDIDGQQREIRIEKGTDVFKIEIGGIDGGLTVPIYKQAEYEPPYRFAEREAEFYREVHTSLSTHPVLKFLNELPTPMFLDLERRYQGPRSRRRYMSTAGEPIGSRNVFGGTLAEGLAEAIDLAEDSYRQWLVRQQEQMNKLRRDLILTAFTSVGPDPFSPDGIELPNQFDADKDLRQQRELVSGTLVALDIADPQIDRFFDEVEAVLQLLAGRDLDTLIQEKTGQKLIGEWLKIQPQLSQINRMVAIVKKHNERIAKAYADIERFLALINSFLGDGGKRLDFQGSGRLRVFYRERPLKGVAGLSSGERQLVVILTHLAFNPLARQANVLIIDEPELSLHVKWQEMFVGALEAANDDLQFILATHSPSIILGRVADCVDVAGHGE